MLAPGHSSQVRETRIDATVMRTTPPEAGDTRPWRQHQCPHCQRIYWAWAKGTISYWHRNPARRAWHFIKEKFNG